MAEMSVMSEKSAAVKLPTRLSPETARFYAKTARLWVDVAPVSFSVYIGFNTKRSFMRFKFLNTILFTFVCVILICSSIPVFAQEEDRTIGVKAVLPASTVTDTKRLALRIIICNKSDTTLRVYKKLEEGYLPGTFENFSLIIEKREGERFKVYEQRSFIDGVPSPDTAGDYDSFVLKEDKAERVNLSVGDSIVFTYHLDNTHVFYKGEYRVKCGYNNNVLKENKLMSKWVYFNVLEPMPVTKYYDQ